MNTRFSLSIILTIGAFVISIYLFGVCVLAYNEMGIAQDVGCGVVADDYVIAEESFSDHPGAQIFKANCKACHAIDRKLVGPALGGVMYRQDSLWLVQWIRNSSKMIADGDPMAVALFEEYNKLQMTSFTSLSDEDMKNLLEYLQLASEPKVMPVAAVH